jgi:ADP-ribosylglycohydrolase
MDKKAAAAEPDDYQSILALRPAGKRKLWKTFDKDRYLEKAEGALLARFAGCLLGVPVEGWSFEDLEQWAAYLGIPYPPRDYWPKAKDPNKIRYGTSPYEAYTKGKMKDASVDDDITYTILGLLIAEKYGFDFTTADVGNTWVDILPMACTAEAVALNNLKKGIPALKAAEIDNPYVQWIGADIRSDPWAYLAPAWPEKAADFAYRDAYLSHRRNGIYGEMFFSAVESAAFAVDNALDAVKIGLTEIPKDCTLYREVRWAVRESRNIHNYKEARAAVDQRYIGMHPVHTINNAVLTIFGLVIGGNDVTKVLGETVAMGLDNDCTAATAGSIVGAIVGKKGVPEHWYKPFKNKVLTYLRGEGEQKISDLALRFGVLAKRFYEA